MNNEWSEIMFQDNEDYKPQSFTRLAYALAVLLVIAVAGLLYWAH